MPRKSAAALAVVRLDPPRTPLAPPEHLEPPERQLWAMIVGSRPADHFVAADRPLIERYVANLSLAAEATAMVKEHGAVIMGKTGLRPSPWVAIGATADKAIATLAAKLRVCPGGRMRIESTGRKGPRPSIYDRMEGRQDD